MLVASLGITEERAKSVDFSSPMPASRSCVGAPTTGFQAGRIFPAGPSAWRARRRRTRGHRDRAPVPRSSASTRCQRGAGSPVRSSRTDRRLQCRRRQIETAAPGRFDRSFTLSQQVQGIAVRKGQVELLAAVNAFLDKVRPTAQLNAIHEKWLGAPLPDFVATEEDDRREFSHDEASKRIGAGARGRPIIVRMEGVNKWYGGFQALKDIELGPHRRTHRHLRAIRAPASRR